MQIGIDFLSFLLIYFKNMGQDFDVVTKSSLETKIGLARGPKEHHIGE